MEDDAEDDRQPEEDHRRVGQADAGHTVHPEVGVGGGKLRDDVRAEEDLADARVEQHRADGHGDRRQADARDEKGLKAPRQRAADQDHDDDRGHRPAVHPEESEQAARQAEGRRDREVDLAGNDDQRHGQRHDRQLTVGEPHVEEVVVRQELATAPARQRRRRRTSQTGRSPSAPGPASARSGRARCRWAGAHRRRRWVTAPVALHQREAAATAETPGGGHGLRVHGGPSASSSPRQAGRQSPGPA